MIQHRTPIGIMVIIVAGSFLLGSAYRSTMLQRGDNGGDETSAAIAVTYDSPGASTSMGDLSPVPFAAIGGSIRSFGSSDGQLYIGIGARVATIDLENLEGSTHGDLQLKSISPVLPGIVQDIVISDGFVYVALQYGGLQVLGTASGATPLGLVSSFDLDAFGYAVTANEALVIVATQGGLHVLDFSDPSGPTERYLLDLTDPASGFSDIAYDTVIMGDTAYVMTGIAQNVLYVLDISDVDDIREVNRIELGVQGYQFLAAAHEHLYMAAGYSHVAVFDTEDPLQPKVIGDYVLQARDAAIRGIVVSGDTLTIAAVNVALVPYGILETISLHDPSKPALLKRFTESNWWPEALIRVDNRVYTSSPRTGAVRSFAVDTPEWPVVLGERHAARFTGSRFARISKLLFATDKRTGVNALDITTPRLPRLLGRQSIDIGAVDVVANETRAYILTPNRLISVPSANVSADPVEELSLQSDVGMRFATVDITESLGVIIKNHPGQVRDDVPSRLELETFDFSNNTKPLPLGKATRSFAVGNSRFTSDSFVVGTRVLIAQTREGVLSADISNPSSPHIDDNFVVAGDARSVTGVGMYMFVGIDDEVAIFERRAPDRVQRLRTIRLPGPVYDVALSGDRLYATYRYRDTPGVSGMAVIDASNVRQAKVLHSVDLPGDAGKVTVDQGIAWVSCGDAGLIGVGTVPDASRELYMPLIERN